MYNSESIWETRTYLNKHIIHTEVVIRALEGRGWCHMSLVESHLFFSTFMSMLSDTWPGISKSSGNDPRALRREECFRQVDNVQKACLGGNVERERVAATRKWRNQSVTETGSQRQMSFALVNGMFNQQYPWAGLKSTCVTVLTFTLTPWLGERTFPP